MKGATVRVALIYYRSYPVIGPRFVTADHAGAPSECPCVLDGYFPFAEAGNLHLYQFCLGRGMRFMTDFAGTALVQPVDMEIMEIAIAIAETGQGVGTPVLYHLPAVTFEAEGKIIRVIRKVELFRKLPLQKF